MEHVLERAARFRDPVFPLQQTPCRRLASDGQSPKALTISCVDARVMPEIITQAAARRLAAAGHVRAEAA